MNIGEMVRAGASQPMKIIAISPHGIARCILVDSNGFIRWRYHPILDLTPLWLSLQPRSLWAETTQVDAIAVAREEEAAAALKQKQRRLAKRQKRSHKIRRRMVPA